MELPPLILQNQREAAFYRTVEFTYSVSTQNLLYRL